jgi:ABC-2 type transport system permease protein
LSLWRLEWLRLLRTHRWLTLLFFFVSFGLLSPLTVRYLADILETVGGTNFQVTVGETVPTDGMREYMGNVQQLGTLIVVLISATAFSIDSRPELSVFFRSRVSSVMTLLLPKFGVNAAFAAAAFGLGAVAAWYETEVLLGSLPFGRTLMGILSGMAFQVFIVATVALAAGIARNFAQTAVVAVALLLSLPLLGLIEPIAAWQPGRLATFLADLQQGRTALDYLRPILVATLLIPTFLVYAARRLDRREI